MKASSEPRRRKLPGPIRESIDFYRAHPGVLVVALVVAAALVVSVLIDGGIDLGEAVAVVASGLVVGIVWAALRALRRDEP